ncbi:MAG: Chemotaxis protein methyltransferase CheR [Rhodanobacteraceae bacterium]|jgi:PAS domain S-box-containing protein|nr:MAG: Chemotaxis protein methyltransferase CheR [Rhodanobacteraceae bacterium]
MGTERDPDRARTVGESGDAEPGLRESEAKYRALFESIEEAFCILRVELGADGAPVDLHFREVNQAFERHTGRADVVGKSARELFPHPESHWLDAVARVLRSGQPERIENFQSDLGRWFSVRYSRIGGEGSRLLAVVFNDITERKQTEITNSRLAAIVESSDDAIIRKDLNGIIETWNAGAERIFGYTADEVIGKPVTILMPPDRVNEEPGILARLRRGERVDHYETVRQRKDGSLIDIALTVSPIMDRHGKVVAASKIARDISSRKQVDRVLRESEHRHEFLLTLSDALREQPGGDAIGAVCVRMLAQHLEVDRCYMAQVSLADNRARMIAEHRGGDLPPAYGMEGEVPLSDFPACMRRLETEPLTVDDVRAEPGFSAAERQALLALQGHAAFIAAPLRATGQHPVWALVVGSRTPRAWTPEEVRLVEDVAERAWSAIERARKDAALREREAELQRASRAKDEFIAMLGHELRNPLAPIATTLQLMKLRAPDVLTRERGVIEAQVQHLTGLVNDLLDVARIATGKVELDSERVDIAGIVAAAVETTQPAMESGRQTLHVHVEEGLVVRGDRRRLVQVLVNLLGNAAKYSPPDRNVWLSAKAEDGQVVLRVRDEGQGIAPDLLPRIFESFIQDERALDRSRGGLGLGLSIVRSIVLLHGGSVAAASDGAYKGSEFTVRLPLLDRTHAGAATEQDALPAKAAALAERIRVLVVDDYAPAAENLALLLQEMGYRTAVASDGAAALATMQAFNPQVALVDIGLPVIDGYEVAQTVRRTAGFEHLPLVAITGYGQASDRARAIAAGFNEHLVKPLDAMHVSELIERLVAEGAVTALSGS